MKKSIIKIITAIYLSDLTLGRIMKLVFHYGLVLIFGTSSIIMIADEQEKKAD